MPELPEVETVRRGLDEALRGATIAAVALRRRDLRTPFPKNLAEALTGRKIAGIGRRAKYLLFSLDSDDVLVVHLGMTGRFLIPALVAGSGPKPDKHDHVLIELTDGRTLIFNDARRFGLITLVKKSHVKSHPLFADLGPEPFEKNFSAAYLKQALLKRKGPIKPVLMDQHLVVGVGNIYASEALFLAGIDPRKPAHKAAYKAQALVDAIRKVLADAIASGGSSLRDFLHITGYSGDYQHRFSVYGRTGKPCFRCHTPVRNIRQSGRSGFYCKTCQK